MSNFGFVQPGDERPEPKRPRQGLTLTDQDIEAVRALIREEIAAHHKASAGLRAFGL